MRGDPHHISQGWDPVDLDNAVFHLLRRVLQEHGASWQARLPRLTKPQYAVLHAIGETPGIEQAALRHRAAIDKATLASLLVRMEQRGLIERTVDSEDRRHRLLRLTADGSAELAASIPVADSVDADMLDRLTLAEREQLHALLGKLAAAEESAPAERDRRG